MKIKDFDYYYRDLIVYNIKWCTNNNKILKLTNKEKGSIAHILAYNSNKVLWITDNNEILMSYSNQYINVKFCISYAHPFKKNSYAYEN